MVSIPAEPADSFADQVLPYARQLHSAALRQGTNLPAWLYRIQANTFYGGCRTRGRRPREIPLDVLSPASEPADFGNSAEDVALARMTDPALRDTLRELPGQIATTVYLADAQGYRYAEIAELTGVPLGTVMSRLHRGRKRLRALLRDQMDTCTSRAA